MLQKTPKPRAVLFDWDDTIIDVWQTTLEARNIALSQMGVAPWTDEEARRRVGPSGRDLFKDLFGDRWQEADKIYLENFYRLTAPGVPVFPHAEDILKTLSGHGIYLAVVSNRNGPSLRSEAALLQFDRYFSKMVGAGDAKADKPHPEPVYMALQGSGIKAGADVWFIGDSPVDMRCAINAGCTPLLIETKPPPEDTLVQHPPAQRFKKHIDIMEFIKLHFS